MGGGEVVGVAFPQLDELEDDEDDYEYEDDEEFEEADEGAGAVATHAERPAGREPTCRASAKGAQIVYAADTLQRWLHNRPGGPLEIAAAAWVEVHHPEQAMAPPDVLDVETAFQLALSLLKLPTDLRGSCRLGVQIPGGPPLMAGATVEVDRGAVVSSSTLLEEDPETWATGSPIDWLDTLVDPAARRIKAGGDTRLAGALIGALHERLFTPAELTPPGR